MKTPLTSKIAPRHASGLSHGVKKHLLVGFVLLFFTLAPHVFAADTSFVPLAPIPGLTDPQTVSSTTSLADFFNNLYKYLIGLAAALAVIEIIWGGLEISTQDSVSKHKDGKDRIQQAILGLVLVLSPVLVFTIINPSILNLSLSLPPIQDIATTGGGTGTQTTTTTTPTCTWAGTAGILQLAVCPSTTSAQTLGASCDTQINTLNISSPKTTTNSSNGVASTRVLVSCSRKQKYTLIDKRANINITSAIDGVAPLVSAPAATTTNLFTANDIAPSDPNNGSSAVQFVNICSSSGLKTCISDIPAFTFQTPCGLTGSSASSTWKCYRETLTCEDSSITLLDLTKCADKPPMWTPFQ